MTAIILLNWNGIDDTLACLDSLMSADGDFFVVVADNGSTDDSVSRLNAYAATHTEKRIIVLPLEKNFGFAVGNNMAIRYSQSLNPDTYLLLNNDTEVNPDFLIQLIKFSSEHAEYRVLTSRIHYYYNKRKIWLCGGEITFGSRKRYYHDSDLSEIKNESYLPISFVSGCCLFFYPELLDDDGVLLSDRFFFGEEDYEFSLRMKELGVKMACVMNSVIYHKVGASKNKLIDTLNVGKDYSFYLGKLIGCKMHYGGIQFAVLLFLMFFKIFANFRRKNLSVIRSLDFSCRIVRDAINKTEISCADFCRYMSM